MALAIGHRGKGIVIVDCLREIRPPFSSESAVAEFSETLKAYGVSKIVSDKWGGSWPVESCRGHGIVCEASAKVKSDLYRELLPAINSRKVDLLDHPRSLSQLCSLERRVARGGKDSIDHPPNGHDDLGNCIAGVFSLGKYGPYKYPQTTDWISGPVDEAAEAAAAAERFQHQRFLDHCLVHSGYYTRRI